LQAVTGRRGWSDEHIAFVTDVLDLVVVANVLDVLAVVELAADADQHDLSVLQVVRMIAIHCSTIHKSPVRYAVSYSAYLRSGT